MKKRFMITPMVLMIAIATLTGCAKNEPSNQATTPILTQNERTELIINIGTEPDQGFDPITGWGTYGSPLFQSTLFKRDSKLAVVNDLATDYSVSDDGLVWDVKLREGAFFNDGVEVTTKDVVFTFEKAAQSASIVDLTNMATVEAVDQAHVRFTLIKPQITFLSVLVSTGIVPAHAYTSDYADKPLVGSGPFEFVQWDKGQQLIVKANERYYGDKPFFSKLTFLFLDQDAALLAAKSGQLDMTAIPATFAQENVAGTKLITLNSVDNRGIVYPFVAPGETKDGVPIGNAVTSDIAIRQAIDIAIDRQELIDGILNGYGTPASSICDGLPWWNEETKANPKGDLDAAQAILKNAGWVDTDEDGVVEKDGVKAQFTLYYPSGDKVRQSLAIAVADNMKKLGIQIAVDGKNWNELEKVMHSSPILMGWGGYNALEMYNVYSSTTRGIGYFNNGYYANPTVDAYMEQALLANSEDEANVYWKKAQWDGTTGFSALGDVAWSWLVNINHLYLVNERLDIGDQKVQPHGHGWPVTSNIEQWKWID